MPLWWAYVSDRLSHIIFRLQRLANAFGCLPYFLVAIAVVFHRDFKLIKYASKREEKLLFFPLRNSNCILLKLCLITLRIRFSLKICWDEMEFYFKLHEMKSEDSSRFVLKRHRSWSNNAIVYESLYSQIKANCITWNVFLRIEENRDCYWFIVSRKSSHFLIVAPKMKSAELLCGLSSQWLTWNS